MKNNYFIIKQIIDLWDNYEEEAGKINLLDFAEWMVYRIKEEPSLNKKQTGKKRSVEPSQQFEYLKFLDEKSRLLEYISRIARLQDFYIRKFFIDLPLNNRLEFLFLHTVYLSGKAKKTDLINIHLVEYTTGMDTISRLIKNGLIEEKPDETDKRAKLLVLTKAGEKILDAASKKLNDEKNMFLACISENKWKKTLPFLSEISDFHNNIYINHNDKPYPELLNLMDSLKHLYK